MFAHGNDRKKTQHIAKLFFSGERWPTKTGSGVKGERRSATFSTADQRLFFFHFKTFYFSKYFQRGAGTQSTADQLLRQISQNVNQQFTGQTGFIHLTQFLSFKTLMIYTERL